MRTETVCFGLWGLGVWLVYAALSNNYGGVCCTIRWFVPLLAPAYFWLALLLRDLPQYRIDFVVLSGVGGRAGGLSSGSAGRSASSTRRMSSFPLLLLVGAGRRPAHVGRVPSNRRQRCGATPMTTPTTRPATWAVLATGPSIAGHAQEQPGDHPEDRRGLERQAQRRLEARLHPDVAEQAVQHAGHAAEQRAAGETKPPFLPDERRGNTGRGSRARRRPAPAGGSATAPRRSSIMRAQLAEHAAC